MINTTKTFHPPRRGGTSLENALLAESVEPHADVGGEVGDTADDAGNNCGERPGFGFQLFRILARTDAGVVVVFFVIYRWENGKSRRFLLLPRRRRFSRRRGCVWVAIARHVSRESCVSFVDDDERARATHVFSTSFARFRNFPLYILPTAPRAPSGEDE